jgi:hypothetical protein
MYEPVAAISLSAQSGHRERRIEMAMDMLRELASARLPATFRTATEIDKIKLLRAAGLVIALTSASSGTSDAAQVLAITEKGREELAKFSLPGETTSMQPARASWWKAKLNATVGARRLTDRR